MGFLPVALGVGGSLLGGAMSGKGAQKAAQTAADAQTQLANQQFDKATGYLSQQQNALRGAIGGLGPNPFMEALSHLRQPGSQNTYQQVGNTAAVPQFGTGGQPPQYGTNGAAPPAPPQQPAAPPPPLPPSGPPSGGGGLGALLGAAGLGPPRATGAGFGERRAPDPGGMPGLPPSGAPAGGLPPGAWNVLNALRARGGGGGQPISGSPVHPMMDR